MQSKEVRQPGADTANIVANKGRSTKRVQHHHWDRKKQQDTDHPSAHSQAPLVLQNTMCERRGGLTTRRDSVLFCLRGLGLRVVAQRLVIPGGLRAGLK